MDDGNNKSQHWSEYWKSGQLTSLPQDFVENYSGEILDAWESRFKTLSNNSKILDLCAGNCAVSILASQYSRNFDKNFKVTATDAADINKKQIIERFPVVERDIQNIEIVANTYLEDLELASANFDLITSQYGIEYCDWKIAADKVYQLLKKRGEFTMISHSGSTDIIKQMEVERNDYLILSNSKLLDQIRKFYTGKNDYFDFRDKLKKIQPEIVRHFQKLNSPLLRSVLMLMDNLYHMSEIELTANKERIIGFVSQLQFAELRMNDLLSVTQRINNNPNWYHAFEEKGLKLQTKKDIYYNSNQNSGVLYTFIK